MTNNVKDQVLEAARENKHWTNDQVGKFCGTSEATVRRIFKKYPDPRIVHLDYNLNIVLDQPIRIPLQGGVMIAADWHIPLYDKQWINRMLDVAIKNKIRRIILAGDLFNFDALSNYEPKQVAASLQLELSEGRKICTMLDQLFDEIIFIFGNHDGRLTRSLGHKIGFADSMRAVIPSVRNFSFTNLDHCWVDVGRDRLPWYVCHPKAYSSVPLTAAIKLANKHNANVVTAHSHHLAAGYGTDGKKKLVESGGLFDNHSTAYLQASTTHPTWSNGFCWLNYDGVMNVEGHEMAIRI